MYWKWKQAEYAAELRADFVVCHINLFHHSIKCHTANSNCTDQRSQIMYHLFPFFFFCWITTGSQVLLHIHICPAVLNICWTLEKKEKANSEGEQSGDKAKKFTDIYSVLVSLPNNLSSGFTKVIWIDIAGKIGLTAYKRNPGVSFSALWIIPLINTKASGYFFILYIF